MLKILSVSTLILAFGSSALASPKGAIAFFAQPVGAGFEFTDSHGYSFASDPSPQVRATVSTAPVLGPPTVDLDVPGSGVSQVATYGVSGGYRITRALTLDSYDVQIHAQSATGAQGVITTQFAGFSLSYTEITPQNNSIDLLDFSASSGAVQANQIGSAITYSDYLNNVNLSGSIIGASALHFNTLSDLPSSLKIVQSEPDFTSHFFLNGNVNESFPYQDQIQYVIFPLNTSIIVEFPDGHGFSDLVDIDDTVTNYVALPEGPTWALMILGLGGLGRQLRSDRSRGKNARPKAC